MRRSSALAKVVLVLTLLGCWHSDAADLTRTVTAKSDTASASSSFTPSLSSTASASLSRTHISQTSSATGSLTTSSSVTYSAHSGSGTVTQSDSGASQSISGTNTEASQTKSAAASTSATAAFPVLSSSASKSSEASASATRSAALDPVRSTHIRWVQRPLVFAAPGIPFSRQPVVAVSTSLNSEVQLTGVALSAKCVLSTSTPGVVWMGSLVVPLVNSLCVFSGVGIVLGPVQTPISIAVRINTTASRFPRYHSSSNSTTVILAQCDALTAVGGIQYVYSLSPPRTPFLGLNTTYETIVSGYSFSFEQRHQTRCNLNMSLGGGVYGVVTAPAVFLDMCHLRCVFSRETVESRGVFDQALLVGPQSAYLFVTIQSTRIGGHCTGTDPQYFVGHEANLCGNVSDVRLPSYALGCEVQLVGNATARVVFSPATAQSEFPLSTRTVAIPSLRAVCCDSAHHVMLFPSPARLPALISNGDAVCSPLVRTLPLQGSSSSLALVNVTQQRFYYGLQCQNVSVRINASDHTCGAGERAQPVRWRVDATQSTPLATFCIENSFANATFVTNVSIANEASVLPSADNRAPLPVPLALLITNWLGYPVVGDQLWTLVSVEVWNASLLSQQTSSAPLVTLEYNVSLSASPVVLDQLIVPTAGSNLSLRITILRDAFPTAVLWKQTPNRTLTVMDCSAYSGSIGIVEARLPYTGPDACSVVNGTNVTKTLRNRVKLRTSPTADVVVASIRGWRFDYQDAASTLCHYSTLADPWTAQASSGVRVQWISSCEVLCPVSVPSQPVSHVSAFYADPATGAVLPKRSPAAGSPLAELGTLRVKFGQLSAWSNSIDLDVVGPASALSSDSWIANSFAFQRRQVTVLDPLVAFVVDALGTRLADLDTAPRLVTVMADASVALDLNISHRIFAIASTCAASPASFGAATFGLTLIEPTTGTYSLTVASPGLASLAVPLYILPFTNYSTFTLGVAAAPLGFNVQTLENPLGKLPVQPVLLALSPTTQNLDSSVSDIAVIATVRPVSDRTPVTTGVNLDPTVCNDAFGNCAVFQSGYASFKTLSFIGFPGASYTLLIRLRNATLRSGADALQFNVTTAECTNLPTNLSTMTALLVGATNSSLDIPAEGFLVKGWRFDPLVGLTCFFNGTEFPALIVDYCTARCMVVGGNTTPTSSASSTALTGQTPPPNCVVNPTLRSIRCSEPTSGTLFVCNVSCATAAALVPVTGSNVTIIGRGVAIQQVANVQSPWSLHDGSQVVVSGTVVLLDALLVAVVDARGQRVDSTDRTTDGLVITLSSNITVVQNTLRIPYSYSGLFNTEPNSTCFDARRQVPMQLSNRSTLTCTVKRGMCSFDRVWLEYPRSGQVVLTASSASLTGTASFVLHIVSGPPSRLCLFTSFNGTDAFVPHNFLLVHPPTLLTVDVAGNVFQPAALDPQLSSLPVVSAAQQLPSVLPAERITVRAAIRAASIVSAAEVERNRSAYVLLPYGIPESANLASDFSATFATLTLNATYGSSFELVFIVEPASIPIASVTSPPLLLLGCADSQVAVLGTSSCNPCYSGSTYCDGVDVNCFQCNGSTAMNVTTGYWRYDSASVHAYRCPLSSCVGNTELGTCAAGYEDHSPLCAACAAGYAPDFLGDCVRCDGVALTAVLFSLACVAAVVAVAIIVFVTVTEQEDDDNSLVLLLKVCVNFIQTSGTIGQFAMGMPQTVKQFLGVQNSVSGGSGISISPFNCLAPSFTFMTKYYAQMLGPPIALIVVALLVKAITSKLRTGFRNLYSLVVMVFLFLVYQTLVSQSVQALYCQPIRGQDGEVVLSVLAQDVRVSCLGTSYQWDNVVVFYSLAIYGLGIPVAALILTMLAAAREGWEVAYVRYSFIISGYRLRYWYWEIVILARKICLLLLVATTNNVTLQALLAIWLLTACLVMTIRFQPFVKGVLNQAESLALLVQLVTVNVGLFFRTVTSAPGCGPLCIVISIVLIACNALVFLFFGRHLLLEGYYRVLSAFGMDAAQSSSQRYISIRSIKKTILLQLRQARQEDFTAYVPTKGSSILVSSKKGQSVVQFGDEGDDDRIELLTLRRAPKVAVSDTTARKENNPSASGSDGVAIDVSSI